MIFAQLLAYGQISQCRVERRESRERRDETVRVHAMQGLSELSNSSKLNTKTFGRTPSPMNATGKGYQGNRRLETIEEDPQFDSPTKFSSSEQA